MQAQTLWHISKSTSDVRTNDLVVDKGDILIKSLYSLISTGTERTIASGKIPKNLYADMQVPFMKGSFNFPLTYGYSLVGKVIEGSEKHVGKHVHLMHPHQDLVSIHSDHCFFIPKEITPKIATLASNMETAINAVWDSKVSEGNKILVVGFGIIGALLAKVLQNIFGVSVTVLEKNQQRLTHAQNLGFHCVDNVNELKDHFDIAYNTSAHESGLQICIDLVGYEGSVIELSWYGDRKVTLDLGSSFHSQRKQIISSQVSNIPTDKQPQWNYEKRKKYVFELLKDASFGDLITKEVDFEDTPAFFSLLRNTTINELGIIIKY